MSGAIKALYIYDEYNAPVLEHAYRSRLPSASSLIRLFLAHPAPRPSLIYLPEASPPVTVFSIVHSNLLFLSPSDVDTEPLLVLEFMRRVVDVLEEFVGAPLLSTKLQMNYDVVAQLLTEMCDAGLVSSTEINTLQENVETPSWMNKFLSGVGLPGTSSPALAPLNPLKPQLPSAAASVSGPAIPWRRPGIRHTSNELYVDIIETLSVTIAPSGRLLSALVSGTIAFTAKISGVPDLLLILTTPGGQRALNQKMELPVFHPCVRLARWRERPGELSFVPPDGRFILAGYEADLLPIDTNADSPPSHMEKLFLPALVDIKKSLGPSGKDFEVRLTLNTSFPGSFSNFRQAGGGRSGSGSSTPSFLGVGSSSNTPSVPVLEEVVVHVPISKAVRNITDMRPSRGETIYSPGDNYLEWRIPTKDAGTVSGTATLRCTVLGYQDDLDEAEAELLAGQQMLQGYYDADSYQQDPTTYTSESHPSGKPKKQRKPKSSSSSSKPKKTKKSKSKKTTASAAVIIEGQSNISPDKPSPSETPPPPDPPFKETASRKEKLLSALMPTSATVSFSVKGWLPSGIKVESLNIDPRKSRGLGEGVRPYKGVKYLCVSRKGVERRC
ncbi:putative AP-3 adaptor complex subunit MU [Talaromyces proteolyticus]|uniref:AP-3 adaptor complex subunit MU n=1 Tax=Talaromyces proteolyticus TaxID=1131652 RepID=A0AAD4L2A0_9EURO|nr:putative AP-3 adaptor complex subunit MU [Talaromyces proteolyticus]KAH8701909.1 putative AP-3 adaptor complex subunit MU [Talaromyces proteolyticus]